MKTIKKLIKIALVLGLVIAALTVSALAATNIASCTVNSELPDTVKVTPKNASDAEVTKSETSADGYDDAFYAEVEYFDVTGLEGGSQLVIFMLESDGTTMVPTEDNIFYIDQNNVGTFEVYPKDLSEGGVTYYITVSGGKYDNVTVATIKTATPSYTLGDVNKDGLIDTADALMAMQDYVEIISLTDTQKKAADVDKNGNVDSADALKIMQKYVEIIENF